MARKKYRKETQDKDFSAENEAIREPDNDEKNPVDLNTILLGIVILILLVQTYIMLTSDDDNSRTSSNTEQQYDANEQTTGEPAPVTPFASPGQSGAPQGQGAGGAVAVYSENEIDLGNLSKGQKVKHTFNVQNTGSADLVFGDVSTDPGLLVINGPETTIPPGGSGSITVELNTQDLSGPVTKIVHVNSNSEPAHHHLEVKATVQ